MNYNSKIFWHFTGSPPGLDWSNISMPNEIIKSNQVKTSEDSLQILKKIIDSKRLLATCTEHCYGYRKTDKFCCLTDIPLNYLANHKKYYGDVALGFKSIKVYKEFNPVLYIPKQGIVDNAKEKTVEDEYKTEKELKQIYGEDECISKLFKNPDSEGKYKLSTTKIKFSENTSLEKHFLNHLKITNFSDEEGESFYQEREWRKISDFNFDHSDIESIIVPECLKRETTEYIHSQTQSSISVISWEFIKKI